LIFEKGAAAAVGILEERTQVKEREKRKPPM